MTKKNSQQLEDKLKIIEIETDFFSRKPEKLNSSRYLVWLMTACILVCAYSALTSENNLMLILSLTIAGVQFLSYSHKKQLFNMYSSACEIIIFYKKVDESKI